MLTWDNVKFYSKKYFKTNVELYFCQSSWVSLTQPWQPWISYVTLPKRTIVYFDRVEKEKVKKSWFSKPVIDIRAFGYFPPMTHEPIDITPLLEAAEKDHNILKIDRRLSYGCIEDTFSF